MRFDRSAVRSKSNLNFWRSLRSHLTVRVKRDPYLTVLTFDKLYFLDTRVLVIEVIHYTQPPDGLEPENVYYCRG
jgi:hypothetical protein